MGPPEPGGDTHGRLLSPHIDSPYCSFTTVSARPIFRTGVGS